MTSVTSRTAALVLSGSMLVARLSYCKYKRGKQTGLQSQRQAFQEPRIFSPFGSRGWGCLTGSGQGLDQGMGCGKAVRSKRLL